MRHAFLIISHSNFEVLKLLLKALDDERVDIYLHIDKKVVDKSIIRELKTITNKAGLTIYSRYKVFWGGYSMIKTEMFLLNKAHKTYHDYYHLISGQDFLLESIEYIDNFFQEHKGLEFVNCDFPNEENMRRVTSFNFLQDYNIEKLGLFFKKIVYTNNAFVHYIIRKLHIRRNEHPNGYQFYKGGQWFSITHNFTGYLISKNAFIRKRFRFTTCADEMFMQTIIMNSPYRKKVEQNIMRCIDWNRTNGFSPYTFKSEDYDFVKHSGKLFARKFSDNEISIVKRLYDDITTE